MKIEQIVFATGNAGKLNEARAILGVEVEQFKIELDEIQSTSVEEVAEHKARQAYEIAGKPVLIEDTGLVFTALGELPGALIKWFEHSLGNVGLTKLLAGFDDRSAEAVSCFAMYDGTNVIKGVGRVKGTIATTPSEGEAFGWDPIFIPEGHERTFAQMSSEEKNVISMRARALAELKSELKKALT